LEEAVLKAEFESELWYSLDALAATRQLLVAPLFDTLAVQAHLWRSIGRFSFGTHFCL
jgi:hypothetical protein